MEGVNTKTAIFARNSLIFAENNFYEDIFMKENKNELSCRLNKVGGQAVLEGVMMKTSDRVVTTCRKEDGSLVVTEGTFNSVRKKNKLLNIPFVRGVVNFIEIMMLSSSFTCVYVLFFIVKPPDVIILHQGAFCLLSEFTGSVQNRGFFICGQSPLFRA